MIKFCCMCLYESFILKLTNYDEAQPSQFHSRDSPQSSLCPISLSADMRWVGICRNPIRKYFILIYCLILHGWFGPYHDHGLRIRRGVPLAFIDFCAARPCFYLPYMPTYFRFKTHIFSRRQSLSLQTCMQSGLQLKHPELIYSLFFCSILSYRRFCVNQSYLRSTIVG